MRRPVERVRRAIERLSRERWICPAELSCLVFSLSKCAEPYPGARGIVQRFAFSDDALMVGLLRGQPLMFRHKNTQLFSAVHGALMSAGLGWTQKHRQLRTTGRITRLSNGLPVEFVILQSLAKARRLYARGNSDVRSSTQIDHRYDC